MRRKPKWVPAYEITELRTLLNPGFEESIEHLTYAECLSLVMARGIKPPNRQPPLTY